MIQGKLQLRAVLGENAEAAGNPVETSTILWFMWMFFKYKDDGY